MAISLLDNLNIRKKRPNVERDLFDTIADMVAYSENYLPEVFECNVKSTGERYRYNVNNEVLEGLGKWRLVLGGESSNIGEAGFSPTIVESSENTDEIYKLDITDKNGTFTTPNLKGAQGIQGSQGERGEQGIQGEQGEKGFSPTITENENNTEDVYKLDIINEEGTFTTPNLKAQGTNGTSDHNVLENREMPNQHPIEAITGLNEALQSSIQDVKVNGESVVIEKVAEIEIKEQDLSNYQTKLTTEQLQNIDDVPNKVNSIDVYDKTTADTTFIKAVEKGQVNGVATLNNMGVIPNDQVNIIDTDVLSEIQLEAVNSGIDEVKVEQIETNKNNIAEIKNTMVTTTTNSKVESMTQAEYNALATKDSKTLYNITDKSSITNDFNEASDDNTFSASFIKNNFLTSQATFTVSSNEDLTKWATNVSGNDYTSVYIAPGTYTLESGSINLTATGTKIVEGHPNAKLVFKSTNVAINTNYYPALYYTTRPDSQEYKMVNVIIDVTSMNATSSNVYATGFYNCVNMLNCYATSKSTGTKDWQAAYGYYACSYLINCQGASSGANNGNAYTFASCSYLTNCIADETVYPATYDSKADIIPYASCSYLINCQAKATNGYELTRGYFGCNYLTGCSATVSSSTNTSTEISGFSRCARMVNCQASITNTTGKTLTNVGGFINSSMIDNCVSSDQIYNSSYVFKCNASAYTSSYADNYLTACDDTSTGGYNHIGTLSWSNNKWQ